MHHFLTAEVVHTSGNLKGTIQNQINKGIVYKVRQIILVFGLFIFLKHQIPLIFINIFYLRYWNSYSNLICPAYEILSGQGFHILISKWRGSIFSMRDYKIIRNSYNVTISRLNSVFCLECSLLMADWKIRQRKE